MRRQRTTVPRGRAKTWSLLVIDSAPIRKKAKSDYERVLRELNEGRSELERFESIDKPGYMRWLYTHFGALLTELREAQCQLTSKRMILFEIESEAFFSGVSMAQAYRRIMRRKDEAASAEAEEEPNTETHHNTSNENAHSDDPDNDFDPFEFESAQSGERGEHGDPRAKNSMKSSTRLKDLYRALARRLHPDSQTEMSRQKLEWWHQTQAAYESGDADQLEVILSLCELADKGAAAETSVSLLKRITAQFRSSLRSLKKQLVRCKKDPAWEFSLKPDLNRLAARVQEQLQEELTQLKRVLKEFEWQLDAIADAAKRIRRQRGGRKTTADHTDFFF